ncbi:MAG: hypothetical protein AB1634_05900 [Thermodesulfobacteriota bacterium]
MKRAGAAWLAVFAACLGMPAWSLAAASGYVWSASVAVEAPAAVALDGGERLYVAETARDRVLVLGTDGRLLRIVAGVPEPISLAVTGDGQLLVGSAGRGSVEVFDQEGRWSHQLGQGNGEVGQPAAIGVDGQGQAYVADAAANTITVYSIQGQPLGSFGSPGSGDGELHHPTALAVDDRRGEIVVCDLPEQEVAKESWPTGTMATARVQVFDRQGGFLRSFGQFGEGPGLLLKPVGVTVDPEGRLYVADAYQNVVQVFDGTGQGLEMLTDNEHPFRTPVGLAIGAQSGRLAVASLNTGRVEIFRLPIDHLLTAFAGPGGSITPAGALTVAQGSEVTFTAAPADGYALVDLLVDGASVGAVPSYTFRNIVAAHSIEAQFDRRRHTVATVAGEHGTVFPAGDTAVEHGADLVLSISPEAGFRVTTLTVDGTPVALGAGGSFTLANVQADHELAVQFSAATYPVTGIAGEGGLIAPAGTVTVAAGADQFFAITPAPGFRIVDVLADGRSVGAVSTYTFRGVQAGHQLVARFGPEAAYTITATAGSYGAIAPSGTVTVAGGAAQEFRILPSQGYEVADVLVDGASVGPRTAFRFSEVSASHSIEALFRLPTRWYGLAVSVAGTGEVASEPGGIQCPADCGGDFAAGSRVQLVATPGPDMAFRGWEGACAGSGPLCAVTMEEARTVTATFLPAADFEGFETGDLTRLPWRTASQGWIVAAEESHAGRFAVMAPATLAPTEAGYLELPLQVRAAGELTFWLKVAGGELVLFVDGAAQTSWIGTDGWQMARQPLSPGPHVVRWEYFPAAGSPGTAWLDDVALPAREPQEVPLPDLKANGLDGPVALAPGERLVVSLGLHAGTLAGQDGDWFVALYAFNRLFFLDLRRQRWTQRPEVSWQGPLVDVPSQVPVLDATGLPAGAYTFFFLLDTSRNGRLDSAWRQDSVQVQVSGQAD